MTVSVKITYFIEYMRHGCFDDGYQVAHDLTSHVSVISLKDCTTDLDAQLLSIDKSKEWYAKEYCYHGRNNYPIKIIKKSHETKLDGFERHLEEIISIPKCFRCVCGKTFWPIKNEVACHNVVPT